MACAAEQEVGAQPRKIGLEYLGMGGIDNTRGPANGTQPDDQEYPGSGGLEGTPAPAGSAPNAGTVAGGSETATLTVCVATPVALLAVNVNVCAPTSASGAV